LSARKPLVASSSSITRISPCSSTLAEGPRRRISPRLHRFRSARGSRASPRPRGHERRPLDGGAPSSPPTIFGALGSRILVVSSLLPELLVTRAVTPLAARSSVPVLEPTRRLVTRVRESARRRTYGKTASPSKGRFLTHL
jgi:hypothetical protein